MKQFITSATSLESFDLHHTKYLNKVVCFFFTSSKNYNFAMNSIKMRSDEKNISFWNKNSSVEYEVNRVLIVVGF